MSLQLVDYTLKTKPSQWSDTSEYGEVHFVDLPRDSPEYKQVQRHEPVNAAHCRIVRVENPYLWGCYQLKKLESLSRDPSVSEHTFWHVTSPSNADAIARENLDWRRASRCRFGQGVSFSPDAQYAYRHSGDRGAQLLCKVLMGKVIGLGGYHTILPSDSNDTTTGNDGKVYVKYYDNEFYPEYIVYKS